MWLLLIILLLPINSMAATYYVGKSGSDGNSCATAQSATAGNRKLTISAGVGCLSSGDTLVIGSGNYDENVDDIIPSGTSTAPTIIQAEIPRQAAIKPTVKRLNGILLRIGALSSTIATLKHDITIRGMVFDGASLPTGTRTTGIEIANSVPNNVAGGGTYNILLDNIEIRHFPDANRCSSGDDVSLGMNTDGSARDIIVRNSHIWDIGRDSQPDPGTCSSGQHYFYGYCLYLSGQKHTVENSELDHCTAFSIHNYSAHANPGGDNIYRNNFIHDNGDTLLTGCGGSGTQVYNNILYNNGFYGYWQRGNGAILLGGNCAGYASYGNFVYNNTIVHDRGACVRISFFDGVSSDSNIVRNNLCYQNNPDDVVISNGSGNTIDHNLLGINPLFTGTAFTQATDFKIQAQSPARGIGLTISAVPTDFEGDPRIAGQYDIGADEYSEAAVTGLFLHWTFDEGPGSVVTDVSGNGNNGIVVGTPLWGTGRQGTYSIHNITLGQYVQTSTFLTTTTYSYSFWFKPDVAFVTSGQNGPLVNGLNSGSWGFDWGHTTFGQTSSGFHRDSGGTWYNLRLPSLPIGAWSFITQTYDGTTVKLYLDGVLQVSQVSSSVYPIDGAFRVLGKQTATVDCQCSVDDVRVYNNALTASEVQALYQSSARFPRHGIVMGR